MQCTRTSLILALVFLVTTVTTGCSIQGVNLVEQGIVSIEHDDNGTIFVSSASVRQVDGELVISGIVRRRPPFTTLTSGFVHIEVIGPDGTTIHHTDTTYKPRTIPRRGSRQARFTVRFPKVPPKGSTVQVKCINRKHIENIF